MITPSKATILAHVPPEQVAMVRRAAEIMAEAMGAAGAVIAVDVHATSEPPAGATPDAVILSLSLFAEEPERPWADVERAVRERCEALTGVGALFLCTVFRAVRPDADATRAQARLRRVRRLNLLATELSHGMGAMVIDLDRALADVGGLKLETDDRLLGPFAEPWAARSVAATLLWAGIDAFGDLDAQDRARERVLAAHPPVSGAPVDEHHMMTHKIVSFSTSRRKQVVAFVDTLDESANSGWWIRLALKGEMKPSEIVDRLRKKIRERGLSHTVSSLVRFGLHAVRQKREGRP